MEFSQLPPVTEIKVISSLWPEGSGVKKVNELLSSNEWTLLSTSSGIDHDGRPMHEWVMGKLLHFSDPEEEIL
ncbi:hypothetical protein E1A00_09925 [Salmonella enterica subsp. enterica serovar Tennessee]|nr:hypothetical protein [Salmonella enterica subsp. enterica serovar Tennessee]